VVFFFLVNMDWFLALHSAFYFYETFINNTIIISVLFDYEFMSPKLLLWSNILYVVFLVTYDSDANAAFY
jgi:hypothetical protein